MYYLTSKYMISIKNAFKNFQENRAKAVKLWKEDRQNKTGNYYDSIWEVGKRHNIKWLEPNPDL